MRNVALIAALALAAPLSTPVSAEDKVPAPAPSEIVAAAPAADWAAIAPADLLVMELAPDAKGKARRVVIQLMPAPFSQGWVGNIRKLAAAHWWDGLAVTRVQDNYVAQWGDPEGEDKARARALPAGLAVVLEREFVGPQSALMAARVAALAAARAMQPYPPGGSHEDCAGTADDLSCMTFENTRDQGEDAYAYSVQFEKGWSLASDGNVSWPVHCYGMVGVGRGYSPDTGSGAELYTVIGHAPRHLDRNIALVGRVIEGIEHLSSLPRGHGPLGTYDQVQGDELVPIRSVRLGTEVAGLPGYEYLSTESASFAKYADARANRRDPFFIRPAGGADICNIPVPVRRSTGSR